MKKTVEMKLNKELKVLDTIEFGYDEEEYFEPCYVNGIYNPDLAWKLRSRAQGRIFNIMKKAGLPLKGWHQFDAFCSAFTGKNLSNAYRKAVEAEKQYLYYTADNDEHMYM